MAAHSAGILLYRRVGASFEVLLAHPGGPFWATRDDGAWTLPKGMVEDGENDLEAAKREFVEETGIRLEGPFLDLGSVTQKNKKIVHAWGCEGDAEPSLVRSNSTTMRWAGRIITVPEIDQCQWFDPVTAVRKINVAQAELIIRLSALV